MIKHKRVRGRKKEINYIYFRYILESQKLTQKLEDTLSEVKMKQVSIDDYKKKTAEADTKFHTQQRLFEAVRSDRNIFRKLLLEAQVRQC
jgi:hypothetical protein